MSSSSPWPFFQALFTVSFARAHCEIEYMHEKVDKGEGGSDEGT